MFLSDLENSDVIFLSIYIVVALIPFINSYRQKTSVALAMVLSLLLVMLVRFILAIANVGFNEIELLAMIPVISKNPDFYIVPPLQAIDVDTEYDFKLAQLLMKNKESLSNA